MAWHANHQRKPRCDKMKKIIETAANNDACTVRYLSANLELEGEEKLFALTFLTVAPLIHILHVWDMQKSCLLGNFL